MATRKLKVTNTSSSTKKGPRNIYLTEVGKLLKPGESCFLNRLENGTDVLVEVGDLKVEAGTFELPAFFPKNKEEASLKVRSPFKRETQQEPLKAFPEKEEPEVTAVSEKPQSSMAIREPLPSPKKSSFIKKSKKDAGKD